MRAVVVLAMGLMGAVQVQAAGVALVLGDDAASEQTAATLDNLGFDVILGVNPGLDEMRAHLASAHSEIRAEAPDRVIVVLSGSFAHAPHAGWLLGPEGDRPTLALADGQGLRLDTVFAIASEAEGPALVWLGERVAAREFGLGLRAGLPETWALPEGVGVVKGPPADIARGLGSLMQPGTALSQVLSQHSSLSVEGAPALDTAFLPEDFAPLARADQRAFEAARETDSEEAYLEYLEAYPEGVHAEDAQEALERIRTAPDRIEAELFLTDDERRAIQRDLSVLGYDTRGIDGIFGPGTRGSIAEWQEATGREPTRYLTRDQIFALAAQAADRAAEIEAEERAAREREERADREFWAMTGAEGDAPGLRSYLDRYPDGIFAGLARERLDRIDAEEREAARDRDLDAWRLARRVDTVAAYERYLSDWPEGEFAELARSRLEERRPAPEPEPAPDPLPVPADPDVERARAAEAALGLSQPTRLLIEQRLVRLGLDPGPVDGVFDAQTRVAIRGAQERFDLRPTGYVDQTLLTMLVSNLFREFFN